MLSLEEKCVRYFGTPDLYKVMQVSRNASSIQIKKAYYKLSLLVHPDRVPETEKKEATAKFQVLGQVHALLQKKNSFDSYFVGSGSSSSGSSSDDEDSREEWLTYWMNLFLKQKGLLDLEKPQWDYVGSKAEIDYLKKAYIEYLGDMDKIISTVPFAKPESEARFIEIVRKWVDDGEVEEFECFFNEDPDKRKRRHEARAKEIEEYEKDPNETSFNESFNLYRTFVSVKRKAEDREDSGSNTSKRNKQEK